MKDREYKDAWQTFKEERTKEYIKLHRTVNQVVKPNNQYYLFQVANALVGKRDLAHILKQMDKLDDLKDGIGDTVVTLIILAQQHGMTLEECLQYAYDEIKGRKGKTINGTFIKESDL